MFKKFLSLFMILALLALSPVFGAPTVTTTDNSFHLVGTLQKQLQTKGTTAVYDFQTNLKRCEGVRDISATTAVCPNCGATAASITWTCTPNLTVNKWFFHFKASITVTNTLVYCQACGHLHVNTKFSNLIL